MKSRHSSLNKSPRIKALFAVERALSRVICVGAARSAADVRWLNNIKYHTKQMTGIWESEDGAEVKAHLAP